MSMPGLDLWQPPKKIERVEFTTISVGFYFPFGFLWGEDTKSVFPISAFAQKSGLELSLTKKLGLISDRSKSDDLIYQVFFCVCV